MQTQPAAQRRTPSKRPAALPYPDLPATPERAGDDTPAGHRKFWLAAWQRDVAQYAALSAYATRIEYWKKPKALSDSIAAALTNAEREARESRRKLINEGGLLFAWWPEGGAA